MDHYWKLKEACTQGQERENVPGYCHSVFLRDGTCARGDKSQSDLEAKAVIEE